MLRKQFNKKAQLIAPWRYRRNRRHHAPQRAFRPRAHSPAGNSAGASCYGNPECNHVSASIDIAGFRADVTMPPRTPTPTATGRHTLPRPRYHRARFAGNETSAANPASPSPLSGCYLAGPNPWCRLPRLDPVPLRDPHPKRSAVSASRQSKYLPVKLDPTCAKSRVPNLP